VSKRALFVVAGVGPDRPENGVDDPASTGRWMAIDWAMRALSVAMQLTAAAGLDDILTEMEALHSRMQERRDHAS
jgi:hypothetical protein